MSQPRGSSDELSVAEAKSRLKQDRGAESIPSASVTDEEQVLSLHTVHAQVEIKAIESALKHTGWNRKKAARLLKISYRGLLYKIHRHNIVPTAEHQLAPEGKGRA